MLMLATMAWAEPPIITSFSPDSGFERGPIRIRGHHLTGAQFVWFNSAPGYQAVGVQAQSDSVVFGTVLPNVTTGPIRVTTPEGTATSAQSFVLRPKLARSGQLAGHGAGQAEMWWLGPGDNLKLQLEVSIHGGSSTALYAVQGAAGVCDGPPAPFETYGSFTTTPAGDGGFATTNHPFVTASPPSSSHYSLCIGFIGSGMSADACQICGELLPITPVDIYVVTPPRGKPGDLVTVAGARFMEPIEVALDGEVVPHTLVNDHLLSFVVPPDATSGPITVTSSSGVEWSPDVFTVGDLPDPASRTSWGRLKSRYR